MLKTKNYLGFTLAEVLITLGIIGVVAAITIPAVLQNSQDQQTVSALKKANSTLSQAFTRAVQENGTPDNWNMWDDGEGSLPALQKLVPYLNIMKNCSDLSSGCPATDIYKWLWRGDDQSFIDMLQLSDGTIIYATITNGACDDVLGSSKALQDVCGYYLVDVNGFKKPNQWGKDLFKLWLTKDGIVLTGTQQESTLTFAYDCNPSNAYGSSCAAWVIYNENLDYLKCHDLDWDTKTKCN